MLHRWQQLIHLLFSLQSMEVYMNLMDDEKLQKHKAKQALVRQFSWKQNKIFFSFELFLKDCGCLVIWDRKSKSF